MSSVDYERLGREFAFFDPGLSDLEHLLDGLRSEVWGIVLDQRTPVHEQIATMLRGQRNLDAVHVVAHGAPGRVAFRAGPWTAKTVTSAQRTFREIGSAIGRSGELRLWSCEVGAGRLGADFTRVLETATGVSVAISARPVGSARRGGDWRLTTPTGGEAILPFTAECARSYAGLLAEQATVAGRIPAGETTQPVVHFIIDADTKTILGQVYLPDASLQFNAVDMKVAIGGSGAPLAIGTFDSEGRFTPSPHLTVTRSSSAERLSGARGR